MILFANNDKEFVINRFLIIVICGILICGLVFINIGCRNKQYNELDARPSSDWVREAVIYEINIRAFSKDGTFKALEAKIPDLKKLGVTVVCLMPIHPIGELNRRGRLGNPYAIKDYYSINHEFGSLIDFKSLVDAIHQAGLKIIIDLVVNQTAWDSQLFMEHPEWYNHNEEGAIVSPRV